MSAGTVTGGARQLLRRALVEPFDRQLERALMEEIVDCETLLDLGCGYDSPVRAIAHRFTRSVGIDLFAPYLEKSVAAGIHTEYRCMDALDALDEFGADSFDCVVALDFIEHLERTQGLELLEKMERTARKKVVVFTPNGFIFQPPRDGNTFQEHRSGWHAGDMRERGYRVIGIHGWRPLRGTFGVPRLRPRRLGDLIALWSQPIVRARPEHAFHLLCIRDFEVNSVDV